SFAVDVSFRAMLNAVSVGDREGQHLSQPSGQFGLASAAELAALPVSLQERFLHHVRGIQFGSSTIAQMLSGQKKQVLPKPFQAKAASRKILVHACLLLR